jgi:hypothetical protein
LGAFRFDFATESAPPRAGARVEAVVAGARGERYGPRARK